MLIFVEIGVELIKIIFCYFTSYEIDEKFGGIKLVCREYENIVRYLEGMTLI